MLTDLLIKMLALRDAEIITALLDKAAKGDVSAIKLIFELTKISEEPAEESSDLSTVSDVELLKWVLQNE